MLNHPLQNMVVTSPFGPRGSSIHNGTDLSAPVGTPIFAPADGRIIAKYENATGGNQLIVEHHNGYKTGYAHLSDYEVENGDFVTDGDIIAYTGNTGKSTGPHLHWTVKKYDSYVDPMTVASNPPKKKIGTTSQNNQFIKLLVVALLVVLIIFYIRKLR